MTMASKYANLPDIDVSADVYETEDLEPTTLQAGLSDEEEASTPVAPEPKASAEELDGSRLPDRGQVGKFFKKAERKKPRRTIYTYPPSPGESRSPSPDPSSSTRGTPLKARLRALQQELAALEQEISDPMNPLLLEDAADTGEMLKGLVDVRGRLQSLGGGHIVGGKREDLIEKVIKSGKGGEKLPTTPTKQHHQRHPSQQHGRSGSMGDMKTLTELDHRVAELEKLVGSNNMALDEASPLPAPLLPQINRLSNQLTLLTQPRHIDTISRRLKLLIGDLERHQGAKKGSTIVSGGGTGKDGKDGLAATAPSAASVPDLAPILQRLSPLLPTIPHLLQRLRTLSSLHTSASNFASSLASLEEDQKRLHGSLEELKEAVDGVEKSIMDNGARVGGNLQGMEERLESLMARLAVLSNDPQRAQ